MPFEDIRDVIRAHPEWELLEIRSNYKVKIKLHLNLIKTFRRHGYTGGEALVLDGGLDNIFFLKHITEAEPRSDG